MIEWLALFPLYLGWMITAVIFCQWFLIHQELLQATREAAWLYSSGRMERTDVQRYVQQYLRECFPPIQIPIQNIEMDKSDAPQAKLFHLDKIRIVYVAPSNSWLRFFFKEDPIKKTCVLEETCVIKHAPGYWTFTLIQSGPPVPW